MTNEQRAIEIIRLNGCRDDLEHELVEMAIECDIAERKLAIVVAALEVLMDAVKVAVPGVGK